MQRTRLVLRVVILWALGIGLVQAQVSRPISPKSNQSVLSASVASVRTSTVDRQKLLNEDRLFDSKDIPRRFGVPFEVDYSLDNSGTWDVLPSGGRLWRLRIESPGAFSINLVYDRFHLPRGATFHVYNEDRSVVIGAFTDANNPDEGRFATAPVPGDVCTVEYFEPANASFRGEITITRIVHGYRDVFALAKADQPGYGESGSCNVNINCPEGADWGDAKRSLAMIITQGGWRLCTGALVNNARQDRTPYFLTANHCLGEEDTWVFMFNYESPGCDNIDGPIWMTTSGAVLRATNAYSDFALIEMLEPPPDTYNVFYAGWSAVDATPDSSATIHHPSGDIKKISFDYDTLTSTAYLGGPGSGNSHWRVGSWDLGTTEPGSSGAPLFNPDHRLIGQLHGGYASCTNPSSDWFGKFSQSWSYGNTAVERLRDWLDPYGTGITTLDGREATGVTIYHVALTDTRETEIDYEVRAAVISNCAIMDDSVLLWYTVFDTTFTEVLSPTGEPGEFAGYIPAHPAGTDITYYLTARDSCGAGKISDTFSFRVLDNGVLLTPIYMTDSDRGNESVEYLLTVTNTGVNTNNYSVTVAGNAWPTELFYASGSVPSNRTGYLDAGESVTFMARVDIPSSLYGDWDTVRVVARAFFDSTVAASAIIKTVSEGEPVIPPLFEPFGDTVFDRSLWTVTSYSQINDRGSGEPSPPYSINLNGDPYGADTVVSQVIDMNDQPTMMLVYYYQQGGGGEDPDEGNDLRVEYLTSGKVWQPLTRHLGVDSPMTEFAREVRSLPYGAYHANFRLRFRVTGDAGPFDDWFVDDVSIEPAPVISVNQTSISVIVYFGDSGTTEFEVSNVGLANLEYGLDSLPAWLAIDRLSGLLEPQQIDTLTAMILSQSLDTGQYVDSLFITSNDPDSLRNPLMIPVTLTVRDWLCGDVDEDLKGPDLADITALIAIVYFAYSPPSHPEAANVDASLDGEYTLNDIVRLIGYVYFDGPELNCR